MNDQVHQKKKILIGSLMKKLWTSKLNKLFHKWIENPSSTNFQAYETSRNKVCTMIEEGKKEANCKMLGDKPSAKTTYRKSSKVIKTHVPYECFVSYRTLLSGKLLTTKLETKVPRLEKSMRFQSTDKLEVIKVIEPLKSKKKKGRCGWN